MIYTVTFNPSIDYYVTVDELETDRTNRASEEFVVAGGKGINVSVILNNLGIETTALGFTAGFTGERIKEEVRSFGFKQDFIDLPKGFSRINVKFKNHDGMEINGIGPEIDEQSLERLYERIRAIELEDTLVLAGSIPKSVPRDIYAEICRELSLKTKNQGEQAEKSVQLVVDATGELLLNTLKFRPFLIKPNIQELEVIFHTVISDESQAVTLAHELQKQGARNVIISMGSKGAILVAEDGKELVRPTKKVNPVNAVGAGDSMIAGFIAGYLLYGDYEKAFDMALAAAGASVASDFLGTEEAIHALMD